jgi:IclR family pca regulon transcriptional regulator
MAAKPARQTPRKSENNSDAEGPPTRDYRIEALAKGLRVLSLFSEQTPTLRLSDIASETGMLMPGVYRIAMTLVSEGYLEQMPDGGYRPGMRVLSLGFSALRSLDMVELATSALRQLADATGETVNLASLVGDKVLYLVRLRNGDLVTANIQVGSTLPAVYTSIGKVLLAHLEEDELRARITPASFEASAGPKAATSLEALMPQLVRIRSDGFATQDEEVAYGLRSVAAPIRDENAVVVAGVNVAVNAMEWTRNRLVKELQPLVLRCADDISGLLGHR